MIEQLLAETQLVVHPERVSVVGLDVDARQAAAALAGSEGLISLVFLPKEVTLIVTDEFWRQVGHRFSQAHVEEDFRLLTLDITLPWNVVGYLAQITASLAEAGISVGVISSFASDHLLIHETKFPAALATLTALGMRFNVNESGK